MLEQIVRKGTIETPTITEEYKTLLLGEHAVQLPGVNENRARCETNSRDSKRTLNYFTTFKIRQEGLTSIALSLCNIPEQIRRGVKLSPFPGMDSGNLQSHTDSAVISTSAFQMLASLENGDLNKYTTATL